MACKYITNIRGDGTSIFCEPIDDFTRRNHYSYIRTECQAVADKTGMNVVITLDKADPPVAATTETFKPRT